MATPLEVASQMYTMYIEAEKAVLSGQSYSIGDRSVTRANLVEIQKGRNYWRSELLKETNAATSGTTAGKIGVKRLVVRDG